jgi:hypothetical protein
MGLVIRITSPYFCAGIVEGRAAPIIKYMQSWTLEKIQEYCNKKKWRLEAWQVS